MPLIEVAIADDYKKIKICNGESPWIYWEFTVDEVLCLDLKQAKDNGGTHRAVCSSYKRPKKSSVPPAEIDEAVQSFLFRSG